MTLHIALDMDDVLVNFEGGVLQSVETEYGVELPPPGGWDDPASFKLYPGYGKGGFWGWMRERDWVWSTFEPVKGAIGGIRTLRQAGHYIELVTSKPEWAEPQVWRWLGKWRPPVQRVTLMQTDQQTKADASRDADVLVDDRPENVQSFLDDGRWGVLFETTANAGFTEVHPLMLRAAGWHELLMVLRVIDVTLNGEKAA